MVRVGVHCCEINAWDLVVGNEIGSYIEVWVRLRLWLAVETLQTSFQQVVSIYGFQVRCHLSDPSLSTGEKITWIYLFQCLKLNYELLIIKIQSVFKTQQNKVTKLDSVIQTSKLRVWIFKEIFKIIIWKLLVPISFNYTCIKWK